MLIGLIAMLLLALALLLFGAVMIAVGATAFGAGLRLLFCTPIACLACIFAFTFMFLCTLWL